MLHSTVIAVASAKGGVGKTTSSINLGTALAARDLDVVVVELDLAMANVVDFLSLEFDDEGDPSMHDVLAGEISVTEALYDAPGGATVVPSGTSLDALGSIDMSNLSGAIEALEDRFDVVVLDTGAGVNSATTTAIKLADETILVSTPRVASIRDTEKTRTIVEQRGGEVGGLVLTQAGTGSSPGSQRLTEFLGVDLLCTVPQDSSVHESQDAGIPVVERRPESEAARAYTEGAAALVESGLGESAPNDQADDGQVEDEPSTDDSSREPLPMDDLAEDSPMDDVTEEIPSDGVTEEMPTDDVGEETPTDDASREGPADQTRMTEPQDAQTQPPSKETLEAQGWTFPGSATEDASDGDASDEADVPKLDVADYRAPDRGLRPLTADGGETSLPDEAYGPASPRHVNVPSPAERLPDELRATGQRDEEEQDDGEASETGDEEAESDGSLAGRVSSFLRGSQ